MQNIFYRFDTIEDREDAINVIRTHADLRLDDIHNLFNYNSTGKYILDIEVSSGNYVISWALREKEEKEETEESIDWDKIKKVAGIAAVGIIGVIIGRKTCRYKKLKKGFRIYAPENASPEALDACQYLIDQINYETRKNHLVYVIDKKYKPRKWGRRYE